MCTVYRADRHLMDVIYTFVSLPIYTGTVLYGSMRVSICGHWHSCHSVTVLQSNLQPNIREHKLSPKTPRQYSAGRLTSYCVAAPQLYSYRLRYVTMFTTQCQDFIKCSPPPASSLQPHSDVKSRRSRKLVKVQYTYQIFTADNKVTGAHSDTSRVEGSVRRCKGRAVPQTPTSSSHQSVASLRWILKQLLR